MAENANVQKLKAAYSAWHNCKGTNADCWLDLMADEVRYMGMGETSPSLKFSGNRLSRQEMVDYFSSLAQYWNMVSWTPQTFLCEGDNASMFGRCVWTSKSTGKTSDISICHLFKFKSGKITEITEIFDTARFAEAGTT